MIFQHTWQQVLDGTKTQTRRLVKPYQTLEVDENYYPDGVYEWKSGGGARTVYLVGNTYAVQPGRGQRAVGRIRITGLRREDVREISDEDVKGEGFSSGDEFLKAWVSMHDKDVTIDNRNHAIWKQAKVTTYMEPLEHGLPSRPADRYDAWVIEFELVKEAQS